MDHQCWALKHADKTNEFNLDGLIWRDKPRQVSINLLTQTARISSLPQHRRTGISFHCAVYICLHLSKRYALQSECIGWHMYWL